MKSLNVRIEGMHCTGCAETIEALLGHAPGVKSAAVSYAAKRGRILYDPAATDPDKVTAAIEAAGFRVAHEPAADGS
jgi:copper chaperone CopZ